MSVDIARLALFTLLPIVLAGAIVMFDRSANGPVRRAEAFLIPLFLVGIGGGGLSQFIVRVFVEWDSAAPFAREAGVASLAVGLLGAVAAERRDGFREAAVLAAVVLSAGMAVVPLIDSWAMGALAVDSILLGLAALAAPALLASFLMTLRREEERDPPTIVLRGWMIPVRRGSVAAVGIAATAYAVGQSSGQVTALSLAGMVLAAAAFWMIVSRAPSHRARVDA